MRTIFYLLLASCLPLPAIASFGASPVAHNSVVNGSGAPTITLDCHTATNPLLLVEVGVYQTSTVTVSDTSGNTWNHNTTFQVTSDTHEAIFWVINGAVSASQTFTITGSFAVASAFCWSVTDNGAVKDAEGGNTSVGADVTASLTLGADNELVVTGFSALSTSGTVCAPSGFTAIDITAGNGNNNQTVNSAYVVEGAGTSGNTVNAAWVTTGAGGCGTGLNGHGGGGASIVSFKDTGASSSPTMVPTVY